MKSLVLNAAMTLAAALNATSASASAVLSIGSETIAPNGTATVALDISGLGNGTALGTFDVNVGFNASIVNFDSAIYGDPKLGDQLNFNGLAFNSTTPGTGTTELFELSLVSASQLVSSQASRFTLALLTFNALETGTSALTLSVNALGDQNGNTLPATLKNGSITIKSGGGVMAPEIDSASAASGLTLLLGALAVLRGRVLAQARGMA